jgi:hypothetical protein
MTRRWTVSGSWRRSAHFGCRPDRKALLRNRIDCGNFSRPFRDNRRAAAVDSRMASRRPPGLSPLFPAGSNAVLQACRGEVIFDSIDFAV